MAQGKIFKSECSDLMRVLEVNRPLHVVVRAEKNDYIYKSAIADFDRGSIYITPPTREGISAHVRNGETVVCVYFGSDAMYEFETTVTGKKKDNRVLLTILERPLKTWRVQRREFFRFDFFDEVSFAEARLEKDEFGRDYFHVNEKKVSARLLDISGGGISFLTRHALDDQSFIKIFFELPLGGERIGIDEIVQIIRMKKTRFISKEESEHTYCGSFYAIDDVTQMRIIRFIMQQQIEQRKRLKGS